MQNEEKSPSITFWEIGCICICFAYIVWSNYGMNFHLFTIKNWSYLIPIERSRGWSCPFPKSIDLTALYSNRIGSSRWIFSQLIECWFCSNSLRGIIRDLLVNDYKYLAFSIHSIANEEENCIENGRKFLNQYTVFVYQKIELCIRRTIA